MLLLRSFLRNTSRKQLISLRTFRVETASASAAQTGGNSTPDFAEGATDVKPPCPGTVNPYFHHIFLRYAAQQTKDTPWPSWPKVVERLPPFLATFTAVAQHKKHIEGVVKVSAYEHADSSSESDLQQDKVDLMMYPAGVWLKGLPIKSIDHVVSSLVAEPTEDDPEFSPPMLNKKIARLARHAPPLGIFVCCHGNRDTRCGVIGERVVQRLQVLIKEREWQENVRVFRCSHVGGHKYAGNVLVYSAISPCNGDWFGGINPENVEAFLDALADVEFGSSGGVSDDTLRQYWRGRMGLTKEEQLQAFEAKSLGFEEDENGKGDNADVDDSDSEPWPLVGGAFAKWSDESSSDSSESSSDDDDD